MVRFQKNQSEASANTTNEIQMQMATDCNSCEEVSISTFVADFECYFLNGGSCTGECSIVNNKAPQTLRRQSIKVYQRDMVSYEDESEAASDTSNSDAEYVDTVVESYSYAVVESDSDESESVKSDSDTDVADSDSDSSSKRKAYSEANTNNKKQKK